MKNRRGRGMPDEIASDDIDKAEALLAAADDPVNDDAASLSLSAQAIGLLLLYFAKEQRDATKRVEEIITKKTDRKMAEMDRWLSEILGIRMPGGK
jgi:hypothetical protein